MCGIAGIFKSAAFISEKDKATLGAMLALIKHRGPDDEGVYENSNCLMGNRRLSIIDLQCGKQPIFNEDKTVAVTYNGEIYNYKELKETLSAKGHRFYTNSDTEVIAHAYEEWDENCFIRFNGMFAIALFDERRKILFLARDRVGMKPLYWWNKNATVVWASEIKAMFLREEITAEADHKTIFDFATFQNTIDEKTFFKGITKLMPGHFARIQGPSMEIKKYWDLEFVSRPGAQNLKKTLDIYEATLKQAINRHLVSDVEVASYLSGGFDSSTIAFFASKFLDYPLKTFTGYFPEGKRYDERNITRIFQKISQTRNIEVKISSRDFRENIEKVIYHLDEPTLGTGALPQYIVAREAAKHVKVILTGHGGDELFAGYQVYKASLYKDLIKTDFPSFIRSFWKNRPDEILKVLYFSLYPLICDEVKHGLFIMFGKSQRQRLFSKDFLADIREYDPVENLEYKYLQGKKLSSTERTLYLYVKTYLPTLFIQDDKMGMAHSIESRMPICDNEMVELSAKIPYRHKLHDNTLKYLTKTMMRKYFPEEFYKHPKMGFPTPMSIWLKGDLKDFVYDTLTGRTISGRGIFNVKYIERLLNFHSRFAGESLYDYVRANKIYSLLMIELWFREFIDADFRRRHTSI